MNPHLILTVEQIDLHVCDSIPKRTHLVYADWRIAAPPQQFKRHSLSLACRRERRQGIEHGYLLIGPLHSAESTAERRQNVMLHVGAAVHMWKPMQQCTWQKLNNEA